LIGKQGGAPSAENWHSPIPYETIRRTRNDLRLGHLRFRDWSFWIALLISWCIVLPEYVLNVVATRYGYGIYTGAQMAAMHLASGLVCVALVSRFILGEKLDASQLAGLAILAVGLILVLPPTAAS